MTKMILMPARSLCRVDGMSLWREGGRHKSRQTKKMRSGDDNCSPMGQFSSLRLRPKLTSRNQIGAWTRMEEPISGGWN